ncbi:MAG: PAS domain S-box protein, partial [Betaproteobacteria bacterium]
VVFTKDLAGRFTMCNAASLAAVGVGREEDLLGKTVFDFYPPELAKLYHLDDMNAIAGQTVFNRDEPSLDRDGNARWFLTIKAPLRGPSGAVVGLIGISRNITDRKATEELLRESEQRFRLLAESLPQLIWTCDARGQCDFFNRQWVEYTGSPADRQLGTEWLAQVHPDDRDASLQTWQTAVADQGEFHVELRLRSRYGSYRWFDTRAVPVREQGGGVLKWVGSNTDIHAAREMREALRAQARLFDLAPVVVSDMAGHIVFWSQGAEALFGFGKTDAVDRLAHELLQSEFSEPLERIREALYRSGVWEGDVVHRAQDGSRLLVHSRRALQTDPHGASQRVLEVSADITTRKRVEEELRNSERRFRALIEHSADGIAVVDQNNTITYLSPAVAAVEGYAPEELIGRNGVENTHPDDLPAVQKIVEELIANPGKPVPVLWRRRHKQGHWLWLEGVATNLLHDPAVAGIVTNYRDVTDRRQAAEVQLRSQKMEALGTLAGGIAHDFNNILLAILGNTKLAMEDLPADHPVQKGLGEIAKGSARAADLVRRILTFTRQQEPKRDVIALRPVVEEVTELLRSTLPAMIELTTKFEDRLPPIAAGPTQIHQLVLNLATNAAYAIGDHPGSIEIAVKTMHPEHDLIARTPDLHAGRYVHFCLSDNGSGMNAATQARIFDPFFTTKPVGSGTGLGLSIVHGIMKSHGGAIGVYSALGKGTTFHLYFPALAQTGSAQLRPAKITSPGAGQRILFVDDEEPLTLLAQRILPRLGYAVSTYCEPERALQAFRANPEQFDAVVTDLSMPGMSGFELARGLLAIRPDIPILMMSGYLRPADQVTAAELNIRDLILKPNAFEDLELALTRLFGDGGKTAT